MTSLETLPPPDPTWAPAYYTKPKSKWTRGEELIRLARASMKAERGKGKGKPLELTAWQQWLVNAIMEEDPETGLLRYETVIVGLPKKNGKSLLGTLICLWALIYSNSGSQIYNVAKTTGQAKIVYELAVKIIKADPKLRKRILIRRDYLQNKKTGAKWKCVAMEGGALQGIGVSTAVLDELHAWDGEASTLKAKEAFTSFTNTSADRVGEDTQVVVISTAGKRKESLLGEQYERGVKVANGDIIDDKFGFFWWEAPEDADPYSEETWKRANPNLAEGFLKLDSFRKDIENAKINGFADFQRYQLNQWVRLGISAGFIIPWHWRDAVDHKKSIKPGDRIALGFDGSNVDDSTGIVAMNEEGAIKLMYKWEKPAGVEEWQVPRNEVNEAIEELFDVYDVAVLYGDQSYYTTDMQTWAQKYKGKVFAIKGNATIMGPHCRKFKEDLYSKKITHFEEEALTRHVLNAVEANNGLPAKEKRNSPHKIDFLMCSILANAARHHMIALNKKRKSNIFG